MPLRIEADSSDELAEKILSLINTEKLIAAIEERGVCLVRQGGMPPWMEEANEFISHDPGYAFYKLKDASPTSDAPEP
jgi:hypothetical protein